MAADCAPEGEAAAAGSTSPPAKDICAKGAVAESIAAKGANSYYFAHANAKDDLTTAQRIEGDGSRLLASFDGIKKLDVAAEIEVSKVRWREDYAWGDEGNKVKVYLEFPEGSLGGPNVRVEPNFEELKFEVVVHGVTDEPQGVTNGEHRLHGKVVPEKCQWRINSSKSRLTVTLVKAAAEEGAWATLKKHNISQHTGWS